MTNTQRVCDVAEYATWVGGHTLMPKEYATLIRCDVPWLIRYTRQMEDALRRICVTPVGEGDNGMYAAIGMVDIAGKGLRPVE